MSEYILKKRFSSFKGLDLKSNNLSRNEAYATDMLNAQLRSDGAITKRKGYKPYASSKGGCGSFAFKKLNYFTGVYSSEVLVADDYLHRLKETTLDISYAGALSNVFVSLHYSSTSSEYRILINDGINDLLDLNLDLGVDELSSYSITSLAAQINALSGFTATVTGDGSIPAAYLDLVSAWDLVESGALSIKGGYWEQINAPAAPFSGSVTHKNDDDFENISSTVLFNVLYLTNGYDEVKKYDGQNIYRAGLPTPADFTVATSAGSLSGSYIWKVQYINKDAVGNVIEGNQTDSPTYTLSSHQGDIAVPNILAASGFNTNCAIADGAQVSVNTITVDNGSGGSHTMKAGDTAYFYDSISASYVEREVVSVGATSITIAGSAVTVADNAVISNNLRIGIYRTIASGVDFYLVAEIPNNSFSASQTYSDNVSDATLINSAQFIEPLTRRDPPPKGKYISQFQGNLMILGNMDLRNTVFFSDVESPEYFPLDTNSIDFETVSGGFITGGAQNNNIFVVMKERAILSLSGDLGAFNVRVDNISNDIGCEAHASIQEIDGALVFLSNRGPYVMVGGQIPQPLNGGLIEKAFDVRGLSGPNKPMLKRAVGFVHRRDKQYLLLVPFENSGQDASLNSRSVVYVFDYYHKAFYKWNNLNFASGMVEKDNEVYFSERRYSSFASATVSYLWKQSNINDAVDYCDFNASIDFRYLPQWELGPEPSVLKRYLRVKLFADAQTPNSSPVYNCKTEINFTEGDTKANIDFDFSGYGYGQSQYGVAPYGDYGDFQAKHKLSTSRVKTLRTNWYNNEINQNVEILGFELEIAYPNRKGLKP